MVAAKYINIPKIENYSQSSLKAGPSRSALTGSPVVGVFTPLDFSMPHA